MSDLGGGGGGIEYVDGGFDAGGGIVGMDVTSAPRRYGPPKRTPPKSAPKSKSATKFKPGGKSGGTGDINDLEPKSPDKGKIATTVLVLKHTFYFIAMIYMSRHSVHRSAISLLCS